MNSSFFFFFLFFFLNSLLQQNKNQYSTYILTQWLTQFQCEKYRVVFVGQSQSHPTLNRISSLWRRFESTSSHKQTAAFQEELIYFCHAFPTADWDKVDCRGKEMSPTLTLLFFILLLNNIRSHSSFTFLRHDDVSVHLTEKTSHFNITCFYFVLHISWNRCKM